MKKIIFISILCAFITAPALADMMKVEVNGGVGSEFLDQVVLGPIGVYNVGENISTFCVETQEYVGSDQYWVTLSDSAIKGGEPVSDILDAETAWIYTQWLDGVYSHTPDNADNVQNAIWIIEDEGGTHSTNVDLMISYAESAVSLGWQNTDIMVMNLWKDEKCTINAQDHLVRVPVPGAVLLGILGLGAAGIKLRRFA